MTRRADSADASAEWHRRTDNAEPPVWHTRWDRAPLMRTHKRADGTLFAEGYACRAGVLEYRQADGSIRRELVPEQTLRDSAAGLARLAVTLEHPDEDVTADNVDRLGVGDTDGEVVVEDGGYTRVKLAVRRRDAVDDVDKKRRTELSPGYRVRLDMRPGVDPVHGPYDAVQVERRYNHLAIVKAARGGPEIRMRTDSADAPAVATTRIERRTDGARGVAMTPEMLNLLLALGVKPPRTDATDAEIVAAIIAKVEQERADAKRSAGEIATRADSAGRERDEAAQRADAAERAKAEAERQAAAEKGRADAAEAELAKLRQAEAERADAAERARLEALAKFLKVDVKRCDGLPSLRTTLATSICGGTLAQTDDAYVSGILAVGLRQMQGHTDSAGRQAGADAWRGDGSGAVQGDGQRADAGGQRTAQRKGMARRWLESARGSDETH